MDLLGVGLLYTVLWLNSGIHSVAGNCNMFYFIKCPDLVHNTLWVLKMECVNISWELVDIPNTSSFFIVIDATGSETSKVQHINYQHNSRYINVTVCGDDSIHGYTLIAKVKPFDSDSDSITDKVLIQVFENSDSITQTTSAISITSPTLHTSFSPSDDTSQLSSSIAGDPTESPFPSSGISKSSSPSSGGTSESSSSSSGDTSAESPSPSSDIDSTDSLISSIAVWIAVAAVVIFIIVCVVCSSIVKLSTLIMSQRKERGRSPCDARPTLQSSENCEPTDLVGTDNKPVNSDIEVTHLTSSSNGSTGKNITDTLELHGGGATPSTAQSSPRPGEFDPQVDQLNEETSFQTADNGNAGNFVRGTCIENTKEAMAGVFRDEEGVVNLKLAMTNVASAQTFNTNPDTAATCSGQITK